MMSNVHQATSNTLDSTDQRAQNRRDSPLMAHLLDALEAGTDIGHYGRLSFVMIARHFLDDQEIVRLISGQPEYDEAQANALLRQVAAHDYNPPTRERILEWQ